MMTRRCFALCGPLRRIAGALALLKKERDVNVNSWVRAVLRATLNHELPIGARRNRAH